MATDVRAEAIKAGAKALLAVSHTATSMHDRFRREAEVVYDVVAPLVRAQTGRDIADAIKALWPKHRPGDYPRTAIAHAGGYQEGRDDAERVARGVAGAGGDGQ